MLKVTENLTVGNDLTVGRNVKAVSYLDQNSKQVLTGQQPPISDLPDDADLPAIRLTVNSILTMLRQHGLIS